MTGIREITPADEPAWRDLWRAYLAFYDTELPEEVYRSSFSRLTDPGVADYSGFLAERDGVPIGLAHVIRHKHGWQIADTCYLQDLYVVPEARGTGAGRALIEAVYTAADAAGTPRVYWLTQEFNTGARQLYDRIASVTPFIVYRR